MEWIDVAVEKPKEDQEVVVWNQEWKEFGKATYSGGVFQDWSGDEIRGVTHFMIPKSPFEC